MKAAGTLAKLLAPCSLEDFFCNYYERGPLHVQRPNPDYYRELLALADLDHYFQAGNLAPFFLRVVKSGKDCPLDDWTVVDKRKNTEAYRIVVTEKLFSLFSEGATIVINAAQTALPGLSAWSAALEQELEISIQPNIYITPAAARGFDYHFDGHDVFVMQISGSKQWRLYDSPVTLPAWSETLTAGAYENTPPTRTISLGAGDLMYLPRGTVHWAETEAEPSVHITVALRSSFGFNLLEGLARIASQDEGFRHALPHGFSSATERAQFVTNFKRRLLALVEQTEIETLIGENQARFRGQQWLDRPARFQDLIRLHQLTLDSTVARRPEIAFQLERDGNNSVIKFANQRRTVPGFLMSMLDSLVDTRPYAIRELQGLLSDSGKLNLVKMFVQAGLLKIEKV